MRMHCPLLLSLPALWIGLWSPRARANPDQVDWDAAGEEATLLLSEYLQIDTVNPPGNESRGAFFLQEKLSAEEIPSLIVESAPGRGNLIARLVGTGEQPPLCLLSHIDVVPSEEENWPEERQPLSGFIDEQGMIWGRGALDMKGVGIIQLQSMLMLARQGVVLDRDIVLLAVADEEVDNTGIQLIAREYWDLIGCSHVLNEGGLGLDDLFFEGQRAYAISVGEKGVLWLKMIASGDPGHGSTPRPDEAPERLLQALKAIETRDQEARIHPAMLQMLQIAGRHQGGVMGFVLAHPRFFQPLIRASMISDPVTRAAITDTVHLTGYGGANKPNVVPSEVYALLDCRLLPGTEPEALIVELEALIDDADIRFEVLSSEPAAVSEWLGDPVYDALAANAVGGDAHAIAGPVISVGFTDSIYLRPLGARAYGLAPFGTGEQGLRSMHGNGEHLAASELERGLEILYRTLWEIAAPPIGVE